MSDSTTYCLLFSSESPSRSTKRDDSVQYSGQDGLSTGSWEDAGTFERRVDGSYGLARVFLTVFYEVKHRLVFIWD